MTVIVNPHFTPKRFQEFLSNRDITEIVYHIGNLAHDRMHDLEVEGRATEAMAAFMRGRVKLFQRRINAEACEYIAVRIWPANHRSTTD